MLPWVPVPERQRPPSGRLRLPQRRRPRPERQQEMIFWRPVTQRAILTAFSLASAPPLVKNALDRFPGVMA